MDSVQKREDSCVCGRLPEWHREKSGVATGDAPSACRGDQKGVFYAHHADSGDSFFGFEGKDHAFGDGFVKAACNHWLFVNEETYTMTKEMCPAVLIAHEILAMSQHSILYCVRKHMYAWDAYGSATWENRCSLSKP